MLYFAYGSNMHKSVFQGRRMIKPAESLPAMLPGWRLTFNQPGLPYSEPAFAAVEPVIASGGANGAHGGSAASSEQQQQVASSSRPICARRFAYYLMRMVPTRIFRRMAPGIHIYFCASRG